MGNIFLGTYFKEKELGTNFNGAVSAQYRL
jgi:hypothetical protein